MTRLLLVIASLLACPLVAQHTRALPSDPREVILRVTVTDKKGAIVGGLPAELFEVYENGEKCTVSSAGREDSPVSIGVLLDHSASMLRRVEVRSGRVLRPLDALAHTREMLSRMMGSLRGQASEFFLVSFNDKVTLVHDFTADLMDVLARVQSQAPAGRTALRDAVNLGLTTMEQASNERRILILISDGGENESASKKKELEQAIRGSEVAVYAISASRSVNNFRPRFSDAFILNRLARRSGGTFLHANTVEAFLSSADQIAYELRNQHVLRFAPRPGDSREWRDLEVKVRWQDHRRELLDAGLKPPLSAHTRVGYYYAPAPRAGL